jgi:hypothetical protein
LRGGRTEGIDVQPPPTAGGRRSRSARSCLPPRLASSLAGDSASNPNRHPEGIAPLPRARERGKAARRKHPARHRALHRAFSGVGFLASSSGRGRPPGRTDGWQREGTSLRGPLRRRQGKRVLDAGQERGRGLVSRAHLAVCSGPTPPVTANRNNIHARLTRRADPDLTRQTWPTP